MHVVVFFYIALTLKSALISEFLPAGFFFKLQEDFDQSKITTQQQIQKHSLWK